MTTIKHYFKSHSIYSSDLIINLFEFKAQDSKRKLILEKGDHKVFYSIIFLLIFNKQEKNIQKKDFFGVTCPIWLILSEKIKKKSNSKK